MDRWSAAILVDFKLDEEPYDRPEEDWQFLLWIMAEFTIRIEGQVFFSSPYFTVVELAAQYSLWRRAHPDSGSRFVFTSIEADEPLLFITPNKDELWLTSPWEQHRQVHGLRSDVVIHAFDNFVDELEDCCRVQYGLEIGPIIRVVGSA